jgi:hypothetical protein
MCHLLTFMNTIPPYWERLTRNCSARARRFSPWTRHAEAEQIVHALKANGKAVEYLVKTDEGHGFENPENRLDFYEKMEAFLEKHLL